MFGKQPPPLPATKEEYVYDLLRDAILSCELRPGTGLVMDRLGEELGMSPIPIRGALQRLQSEGLVEITPHSGAWVSELFPAAVTELFTLAAALESIVMRVLAPKINAEGLELLLQIVAGLDEALSSAGGKSWALLDIEFHCALADLSGMPLLAEFVIRTQESWYRLYNCYFSQAGPQRIEGAQGEHKLMLTLLAEHNGPALEALAVEHHRLMLRAYQRIYPAE
jgi:DNA-binding GntR family transcriptional regulator